jgi:hypothetical protein
MDINEGIVNGSKGKIIRFTKEDNMPVVYFNNGKEIEDNQIIFIPGTNVTKGDFKVKLYDYDIPRYIPY